MKEYLLFDKLNYIKLMRCKIRRFNSSNDQLFLLYIAKNFTESLAIFQIIETAIFNIIYIDTFLSITINH